MALNALFTIKLLALLTGAAFFLLMLWAAVVSSRENEPSAAKRALLFAVLFPLPYLAAGLLSFPFQPVVAVILLSITGLAGLALLIPYNPQNYRETDTPIGQIDERDIMFSRNALAIGSLRFEDYYRRNPDKKPLDDKFREKPGLLNKQALFFNPYSFAAAEASFMTVTQFHNLVEGEVAPEQISPNPQEISRYLKNWSLKLGAVSVGITELKDYHRYSHVGRGNDYGQPVSLNHPYAIAFTVEMDKLMLDRAPYGPTVMESAQQYLNAGAIAVQLAQFIRALGFDARAHIDGNYRVVCPLVARDAGLGELGRMGLLMTPELGPRVRLGVVTTTLPLITDERVKDNSVIDFCTICKKCADVCPSKSIPNGDRHPIDGVVRWQINSEKCFTYWCTVGTDCGRCVSVCPYAHPNNRFHNLIRFGIDNSAIFRRFALKMDDIFYGRKPTPAPLLTWMDIDYQANKNS